jgi:hypothetical protein
VLFQVCSQTTARHGAISGKQLQMAATLFFWGLALQISFLPTMVNHHLDGNKKTKDWEVVMNKVIIAIFVGTI